jgi:2Fe-2S ferredoxin
MTKNFFLIEFKKRDKTPLVVPEGSNLMEALLASGVPVASSCKGEGICKKCLLEVWDYAEKNDTPTTLLSCQYHINRNIQVNAPYW